MEAFTIKAMLGKRVLRLTFATRSEAVSFKRENHSLCRFGYVLHRPSLHPPMTADEALETLSLWLRREGHFLFCESGHGSAS